MVNRILGGGKIQQMIMNPMTTPWKINMEHNNGGLEDHFAF